MTRHILLPCIAIAITALAGCSGDDDDSSGNGTADAATSTAGHASGGNGAAASDGASGAATGGAYASGTGGAGSAATGGSGASATGSGGRDARDAGASTTDAGGEDAAPDYGDLKVLPDTSTEKVADCTGKPDMTLCDVVTTPDRWYDICVDEKCVSPGCGDPTCNAPGPHFRIPPFFDRKALQIQPGDEPVTIDLITGLHWQSCSAGKSGADCTAGTWMQTTWTAALAYCDSLSWAGHDDWYLPDPWELVSIMESDIAPGVESELDSAAFPNSAEASLYHWSSVSMGPSQAMAITSGMSSWEITSQQHTDTMIAVRCVRRGFSRATSPAHARYAQSTDATKPVFVDQATGLAWPSCLERIPGATECSDLLDKVTVQKAVMRCDQLDWAGSTAWRVPTFKELHSLLLYPHEAGATEAKLDERVVQPAGPFLITTEDHLFSTDGRRVELSGTYPYLCVRGPVVAGD